MRADTEVSKWHNPLWHDRGNMKAFRMPDVENWRDAGDLSREGEQEARGQQDQDDDGRTTSTIKRQIN